VFNKVSKFNFWLPLVILFIGIDQATKWLAIHFGWSIFFNSQFAFSLPVPQVVMYLIYVVVLVGMTVYVYRTWHRFSNIQILAWAFVYAGGLSNIGERIALGYVRDFISISSGTLNVADFFIIIGLVLLLVSSRYTKMNEDSGEHSTEAPPENLNKTL
jgi:lipoprotein signal peptidase